MCKKHILDKEQKEGKEMLKDVLKKELIDVEVTENDLLELEEDLAAGCGMGVDKGSGQCNGSCGTGAVSLS